MSLTELAAFEAAYQALQPLDAASRRRALTWLSDALSESKALIQTAANTKITVADETPAVPVARGRKKAAAAPERNAGKKAVSARGRGRARRGAVTEKAAGSRTYRRMPEPTEVMAAYRQAGTINALAEHFSVPVHTVYSWARRMRSQGYQIGR
jgi:hypothetical protein